MPKCTDGTMDLGRLGRCIIEANFEGGDIGSDGGVLLLRRLDERIGLSRAVAAVLSDPRDPRRITHSLRELLAQRIYGLCCGYEDLNDHAILRDDLLMQTAVGRVDALASSPKLSRLETRATRAQALALHGVLIEQFIDGAKNAAAVIRLLVQRLRQAWPEVRIIVRGDSGFCRQRLLRWCERLGVNYVIGLARNAGLQATVQYAEATLADEYTRTGVKQRLINEFAYAAHSWDVERRVITRLEHSAQGNNLRFVVTDLQGDAAQLYERLYCARGEAENRIKEAHSTCSAPERVATASRQTSCACCWLHWPIR